METYNENMEVCHHFKQSCEVWPLTHLLPEGLGGDRDGGKKKRHLLEAGGAESSLLQLDVTAPSANPGNQLVLMAHDPGLTVQSLGKTDLKLHKQDSVS